MKTTSVILAALVMLATSAPTLALAEYENGGSGQGGNAAIGIFSLTLYSTIFAILGVVGYSIWKVFRIRRRAIRKLN